MIFPVRTEVTTSHDGVVLSFFDHPDRQPLEQVDFSNDEARQLLDNLVLTLYPGQANDILARLP